MGSPSTAPPWFAFYQSSICCIAAAVFLFQFYIFLLKTLFWILNSNNYVKSTRPIPYISLLSSESKVSVLHFNQNKAGTILVLYDIILKQKMDIYPVLYWCEPKNNIKITVRYSLSVLFPIISVYSRHRSTSELFNCIL